MTYSDPIVTYSHLEMTYSYPNVNYSGLKVTYSYPKVTHSYPRVTYVDRLVRGLFLNYLFSRFSSCGLRSQEVISVVLFLETLVLCLLFSNFKKALNQR